MHITKKKIILPLMVFLIGISVLTGIVYNIKNNQQEQNKTTANLNAMTYAERMKIDVISGISVTDTLKEILLSEGGRVNDFSQIAEDMMTDSIQSIQLAPDGIVTEIYPEEGNEAGKIDLIHDKDRGEISCYARDNHVLVMQGPFQLKQGGYGIAVRNPVYLENDGREKFWGFTIVIIRVPDIFADSVKALSSFGYEYRLSKMISPWDTNYEEVYSSGKDIIDPVSYGFELGGVQWKLEVMPKCGKDDKKYFYEVLGGGTVIVLLLTGLSIVLLSLYESRKKFKNIAVTDALTGIYNRHGFNDKVKQYLKHHPDTFCILAQLDVDEFKFINDIYGHTSGDLALQVIAEGMKKFFGENAVLGRNGGDEFCIFLPNCTGKEIKQQMEQFTYMERSFHYGKEEHTFSISLGYAEYPTCAENCEGLMRCADAALYEVKLRGKNGCFEYEEGHLIESRIRLGFALKDISENLPGAFIIYRANKNDDEILFANRELIHLTGCNNMDELLEYTGKHFGNLIREDEQKSVEKSIWKQIDGGNFNDYVYFHLKKADGTFLAVLDHGRIVESVRYGRVFYVLIMDLMAMKEHYKDSL